MITLSHDTLAAALLDLSRFATSATRKSSHGTVDLVTIASDTAGRAVATVHDWNTRASVALLVEGPAQPFTVEADAVRRILRDSGKGRSVAQRRESVSLSADAVVALDGTTHPLSPVNDRETGQAPHHGHATWFGEAGVVRDRLAAVARAAGRDETLPMLAVVTFDIEDGGTLRARATDRFRLAEARIPHGEHPQGWTDEEDGPAHEVTDCDGLMIPVWPLAIALSRLAGRGRMGIGHERGRFTITDGRLTVSTWPLQGHTFVRTDPLWVAEGASVTASRSELREAVTRVVAAGKAAAPRKSWTVTLTVDAHGVDVAALIHDDRDGEAYSGPAVRVPAVVDMADRAPGWRSRIDAERALDALDSSPAATVAIVQPADRVYKVPRGFGTSGGHCFKRKPRQITFVDAASVVAEQRPAHRVLVMPVYDPAAGHGEVDETA